MKHAVGYVLFCGTLLAVVGVAHDRFFSRFAMAFEAVRGLLAAAGGGH